MRSGWAKGALAFAEKTDNRQKKLMERWVWGLYMIPAYMTAIWNQELRGQKNHTLAFVYRTTATTQMTLSIAASNLYRLFINGELKGYGPARAAHGYSRVDEYTLAPYAGKEIILVVEVFAANINSYYIVDELPFFSAELHEGNRVCAQSSDFDAYHLTDRVTKVQRFSFQRTFVESYRMKECRQRFYCGDFSLFPRVETSPVAGNSLLERGVSYPKLQDAQPAQNIESGTVTYLPDAPVWQDRSIQDIGEKLKGYPYAELEECLSDEVSRLDCQPQDDVCTGDLAEGQYRLYCFERTLSGFFHLNVTVKEPVRFYIVWDEVVAEDGKDNSLCFFRNSCCNIIKYDLQPGAYDLLSFECNTARYIRILVTKGCMDLQRLGMVLYENADVRTVTCPGGNAEIEAIMEAAKNTFAQNAVDILTDCPSRERAGWLCDSYFSARAERLFTGANRLERNFLMNYIQSPPSPFLPDGMLPMCYPADHNDGVFIPNWTMWWVLELKGYWERTGDRELIDLAKPRVYDLIRYFSRFLNEDGLLEDLESWVFIEWSRCNDPEYLRGVNYPSNMLYAAMLEVVGELYDDPQFAVQAKRMKQTIAEQSFDGEFFQDNRIRKDGALMPTGHRTETCQYYAFYFGTADVRDYPALFKRLTEEFGPFRDAEKEYPEVYPSNAIVGNYLRLELLLRHGDYSRVLRECVAFFDKMAKTTGTLWENSMLSGSLNHGFASVAANYLVECMEHINPAQT